MQQAIYTLIEAGASMVGFSMAIFGIAQVFGKDAPISRTIAAMSLAIASLFGLSIVSGALCITNEYGLFSISIEFIEYLEKFCVLWFLLGAIFGVLFGIYILARFMAPGGGQTQ